MRSGKAVVQTTQTTDLMPSSIFPSRPRQENAETRKNQTKLKQGFGPLIPRLQCAKSRLPNRCVSVARRWPAHQHPMMTIQNGHGGTWPPCLLPTRQSYQAVGLVVIHVSSHDHESGERLTIVKRQEVLRDTKPLPSFTIGRARVVADDLHLFRVGILSDILHSQGSRHLGHGVFGPLGRDGQMLRMILVDGLSGDVEDCLTPQYSALPAVLEREKKKSLGQPLAKRTRDPLPLGWL